MEIEFSLTEEDFVALSRANARRLNLRVRREMRTSVRRFILAAVGILTLLYVLVLAIRDARKQPDALENLGHGVLLICFVSVILWLLTPFARKGWPASLRNMKRHFQEGRNALWLQKRRVAITSEGFSVTGPFGSSITPWTMVERIAVTPNHAFLCLAEDNAHILPGRAFATEAEFRSFVETARQFHARAGLEKFADARPSSSDQVSESPAPAPGGESGVARPSGNADSVQ
jgi:hypothetical protein